MTARRDVAGVCRFCGCTETDPCITPLGACAWAPFTSRRVCTECASAAKAEGHALKGLRKARPVTAAWLETFHRGFIVGWFTVTPRSEYGRNPYRRRKDRPGMERGDAWRIGHMHGEVASLVFTRTFGPVWNRPRRAVLTR